MIAVPPQAKIMIYIRHIDFRNGINGLSAFCRQKLQKDPMKGEIFVFRNRRRNCLKILFYDGSAYWLLTRRLSRGTLKWWPSEKGPICTLEAKKLQVLITNGNPEGAEFSDDWKKLI